MRKLNQTELFSSIIKGSDQRAMQSAILGKINAGYNLVTPDHVGSELIKLKNNARRSGSSIIGSAIGEYERLGGRVRIVNLTDQQGRSVIPSVIPFMVSILDIDSVKKNPVILMNAHRIGRFTNDNEDYTGLNANTDLFALLESGEIMFRLTALNKSDALKSNQRLLENLTKLYTSLFSQAVVRTSSTSLGGVGSFNNEMLTYLTAKFFLLYALELNSEDTASQLAFKLTTRTQTLDALKLFEENTGISYESLSSFLETLGSALFNSPMDIHKFSLNWVSMYGEGTMLAIEYVPFFIHFMLATRVGAYLGGNSRLMAYRNQLEKMGLPRFYNELVSVLK